MKNIIFDQRCAECGMHLLCNKPNRSTLVVQFQNFFHIVHILYPPSAPFQEILSQFPERFIQDSGSISVDDVDHFYLTKYNYETPVKFYLRSY